MFRHLHKQIRLDVRWSRTWTKPATQWTKTISSAATASIIPRLIQQHSSVSSVVEHLNATQELTSSTGNELLGHYATQGHWKEAQDVYDQVFRYASDSNNNKTGNVRSSMTTYGLLMEAYILGDSVDEAMDIYYSLKDYMEMQPVTAEQKGLSFDTRFYTRLITTLTNRTTFVTPDSEGGSSDMEDENWISPHLGYTVDDGAEEIMNLDKDCSRELRLAITLFQDMRQQNLPADKSIYLGLLGRCGQEKDGYYLQQVHQYLRMDDGIELDKAMVYGLMNAYRKIGDEDAMVFELWGNHHQNNNDDNTMLLDLVLDLCREKKYKQNAARIWTQLGPEQRTPASYRQMVTCLCESGEWNQAKELILVDLGKDRPEYSELVELLVEYGHQQGIQADQWNDLV